MSAATDTHTCDVVEHDSSSRMFSKSSPSNMDNRTRPLVAGAVISSSSSKAKYIADVKHKTGKVLIRKNTPATLPKVDQIYAKERSNIEALTEEEEPEAAVNKHPATNAAGEND